MARLERIKLQEIANAPADALPQPGRYSDPAVVAVGWADGDRLVWPWDGDNRERVQASIEDPEFTRIVAEAERAEFAEKRYERAAELYRQSITLARTDAQRALVQLRLAR